MSVEYRMRRIVRKQEHGISPRYGRLEFTLECGHVTERYYSYPPTESGYGMIEAIRSQKRARCYDCEAK